MLRIRLAPRGLYQQQWCVKKSDVLQHNRSHEDDVIAVAGAAGAGDRWVRSATERDVVYHKNYTTRAQLFLHFFLKNPPLLLSRYLLILVAQAVFTYVFPPPRSKHAYIAFIFIAQRVHSAFPLLVDFHRISLTHALALSGMRKRHIYCCSTFFGGGN